MIQVLEILPGERAIVSTAGLQRVRMVPSGRIIGELLEPAHAAEMVEGANARHRRERAVAASYVAESKSSS